MRFCRSVSTCARSLAALFVILSPAAAHAATIYVGAGGDLQAAINAAQPGDTIMLEPGATFRGTFYLPVHGGTNYVTIRSAASNRVLPPTSTRIGPEYAAQLPKIQSTTTAPALRTLTGAAYWRLMFVEFLANQKGQGDVIALGSAYTASLSEVSHHLILDRIYIHGDRLHGQKRGIALNSADTAIVNSHIDGIRAVGQDTQAIGGWNGPGNYRIENNYLEAAGEVFMLGGSDPAIAGMTPTDVTLRYNTLTRRLSWRDPIVPTPANVRPSVTGDGSLAAGTYAYRVVARRMAGTQVARSLASQEMAVTVGAGARVSLQWDAVPDATEYLVYGRASGAQNQYWKVTTPSFSDGGASGTAGAPSSSATMWQVKNLLELKHARGVLVAYNVMTNNWAQAQNGVSILISPRNQNGKCTWCVVEDITIEYNLIRHAGGGIKISGYDDTYPSQQTNNVIVRHNEFSDMSKAWGGNGYIVMLLSGARDVTFDHNTMVSPDLSLMTVDNSPMENFRFTNNVARHNTYGIKGSGQGVGNTTITYYFPGSVIDRNVLAGGKTSAYPAGNMFPTSAIFEAHFTSYATLDFSLVPATDWEAAGTDALDLGANESHDAVDIATPDAPQVMTASLPPAIEGRPFSAMLKAQGGLMPYLWSVVNSTLPAGLVLDSVSGSVTGSPAVIGDFAFMVQVEDYTGARASRPLTLHVDGAIPSVTIVTATLPDATATLPYTQALQGAGGLGTYVWSHTGGALPAGMTLAANGVLAGTPAAAGLAVFTVTVADAADPSRSTSGTLTLVVAPRPNQAPTVVMTAIDTLVPVGATITLSAAASDADGLVERVDFYAGDALIGSAPGPSFILPWFVSSPGVHRLKAVAVDDRGTAAQSAPVDVTTTSEIVIRAADVLRTTGSFSLVADASAAGGYAMLNPNRGLGKVIVAAASPASLAEFRFHAEAGRPYHLWIRGRAERDSYANDSVHVQFAGVTGAAMGTKESLIVNLEDDAAAGLSGWGWQDQGYGTGVMGTPIVFATTGAQTLRIQPREDGLRIDQIVLSPERYLSEAPGALQNDDTILAVGAGVPDGGGGTPVPEPPPVEEPVQVLPDVVIRASQVARMAGSYEFVADESAAGGFSLWNPDRNLAKVYVAAAEPASFAEFTFHAEAGRPYQLWLRGRAERNSYANDSIHIQFAGMDGAAIGTADALTMNLEDAADAGLSGWGWQDHGYGAGVLGAPVVFATTGMQTMRVQPREDGLVIDQIVLSPQRYLATAPGALTNDTTVLEP